MPEGIDLHAHLAPVLDGEHRRGPDALYEPDRLDAHLDAARLAEAIVSVPPPFFRQNESEDVARQWVRRINDGLLAAVEHRPRQTPLAYLPLEHPELAAEEYQRIREDARFAGVCGAAGGRSVSLADRRFAPLWRQLDADARLMLLHPGSSPDERLEPFYLSNLLGNPVESTVATAQLVFGDVLPRHPALRVLLVHCGGAVPAVAGRWQRGVDTSRPGIGALSEDPAKTLRRIYVDCLAHDPSLVDHAIAVFGPDRLVLGSDWPFPMGSDDPRGLVAHRGTAYTEATATAHARSVLGRTDDKSP